MEQYRIYDRQTLRFIDGGVIRDYTVDMDYLSNNASSVTLTDQTYAKKGDIIVAINGIKKLFIGSVTAVDNTKKTVSFKHMKELFNDTVLNVFKYTNMIGYKFDAVDAAATILEFAFISTDDALRRLPLVVEKRGTAPGAVWTDEGNTINVLDFLQKIFDNHNVYVDLDIDFTQNKIRCSVIKNSTSGVIIKDNIKMSEAAFDKNELPAYNKAIVYNGESGAILGTYYLLENNNVSTINNDIRRLLPVSTKYIEYDADKGYTPLEVATSELKGNIYNHCIQIKFSKEQTLVRPLDFCVGDAVKIIYQEREYDSIFTGLKFSKNDPFYTCFFGKTRIDFTDRLKQYIEKRYKKN